MSQMKISVKHLYSIVQMLYWITACTLCGYAVVYLEYRGLSSTMIGIVVGGGACLSIVVQPMIAQLTDKIPRLTVKRMIQLLIIIMATLVMVMTFLPLPIGGVMVIYTVLYMLNTCVTPFLSAMGMEFMNCGYHLDFGVSRGLGSLAYASFAAFLGFIIEKTYPGVLGFIYLIWAVILFVFISAMEDLGDRQKTTESQRRYETEENMLQIVLKNPSMLRLMIGFCLMNLSNQVAITYMVNIVDNLGGSGSTLGIANFVSAASEMPIMLMFAYLLTKTNCIRLLKVSAVFYVLKPILLFSAGSIPMALLGFGMQGLSFGLFTPAAVYFVNSAIEPEKRVKGQAVFSMVTGGLATCIGNFMGGWMQDAFGLEMLLIVCAVIALAGAMVMITLPESNAKKKN